MSQLQFLKRRISENEICSKNLYSVNDDTWYLQNYTQVHSTQG